MKPAVTAWQRLPGCESNACVEILYRAEDGVTVDAVWLRNTRDPETIVKLTYSEWGALARALASGLQ